MKLWCLKWILILATLLAAFSSGAAAPVANSSEAVHSSSGLNPRQVEILRSVLSVGSELTESMHREFWEGFDGMSEAQRGQICARVQRIAPAALRYQQALWRAVGMSLENAKATRTSELASAEAELAALEPKAMASALVRAERFLLAAASGTPVVEGEGTFSITAELVEEVLAGIHESIDRLRRLGNRQWVANASLTVRSSRPLGTCSNPADR